jgi:hypothetical protein
MKTKIVIALSSILTLASISAAEAFPNQASAAAPIVQAHYYGDGFFLNRYHRPWFAPAAYPGYGYGYHRCHRHHRRWW